MPNISIPSFITDHPIFKHYPLVKVFPAIGLSDCSKQIDIDPTSLSLSYENHRTVMNAMIAHNSSKAGTDQKKYHLRDFVPLQKYVVCFSSSAFDLVSLSMRGLSSCIKWDGERKQSLVGSLIDPYCAAIMVNSTTNTDYGSKIDYRCIVRLIEVPGSGYGLFLERTYCYNETYNAYARWLFKEFLEERTALKVYDGAPTGATIPLSEPVKELMSYDWQELHKENRGWVSYRDSGLQYGTKINCDWSKILPQAS